MAGFAYSPGCQCCPGNPGGGTCSGTLTATLIYNGSFPSTSGVATGYFDWYLAIGSFTNSGRYNYSFPYTTGQNSHTFLIPMDFTGIPNGPTVKGIAYAFNSDGKTGNSWRFCFNCTNGTRSLPAGSNGQPYSEWANCPGPDPASPLPAPASSPASTPAVDPSSVAMMATAPTRLAATDPATVVARLAICSGCDLYDAAADSCRECGCVLQDRRLLADGACPVGKW